jgi:hypothetical protein
MANSRSAPEQLQERRAPGILISTKAGCVAFTNDHKHSRDGNNRITFLMIGRIADKIINIY